MGLERVLARCLAVAILASACEAKNEAEQAVEVAKERALAQANKAVQEAKDEVAKAAVEAANAAQLAQQAGTGNVPEPVDFRELKALLPEKLAGLPRKEATGEKSGAMNIKVSMAEGRYASDDGAQTLELKLIDTGGVGGMAAMSMAAWATVEVDRETEDGFERTTKIGEHKALEKWSSQTKDTELHLFVANRFLVDVRAVGLAFEDVKKSVGTLDLAKLGSMKDVGAPK